MSAIAEGWEMGCSRVCWKVLKKGVAWKQKVEVEVEVEE